MKTGFACFTLYAADDALPISNFTCKRTYVYSLHIQGMLMWVTVSSIIVMVYSKIDKSVDSHSIDQCYCYYFTLILLLSLCI